MNAYSQLQLTNLTLAGALPVPPVVSTPPAPPISLSGSAPQFGIPTMAQSYTVPLIVPSSVPVHVPPHHSTNHPTVASQFVPPHSRAHHHYKSAPANSDETRGHRDSNGSRNAMNMAKCFQNKDSNYSGADNENIMDFIVQYNLVLRVFNLPHHEKGQYVHNLFRGEAQCYYYAEVEPLGNTYADVISKMQSQFNLISKQQCVKAELSELSLQDVVDKSDGDRRKAFRGLVATIESRIPLCPRDWRNESN